MRRLVLVALAVASVCCNTTLAHAGVNVERQGSENAMVEIFRSTIYGALAGLVVGGAIELATKDESGEPVRWGIVIGTFTGLGYGVYQVATRPEPTGLLELRDGAVRASVLPTIEARSGGAQIHLVSMRF